MCSCKSLICFEFLLIFAILRFESVYAQEQWRCATSNAPLAKDKLCDGHIDCPDDGSDETAALCVHRSCEDQYRCAYGACISLTRLCDGQFDCADHSDETRYVCANDTTDMLQQLQGNCADDTLAECANGDCIESEYFCDGITDCGDGSDETVERCAHVCCPAYTFRCGYGACTVRSNICNGIVDCADASDELGVGVCGRKQQLPTTATEQPPPPARTCAIPYAVPLLQLTLEKTQATLQPQQRINHGDAVRFECLYGAKLVGVARLVCDDNEWYKQWPQCVPTQELQPCTPTQWRCAQSGECIGSAALCNGAKNCRDGSDETVTQCITQQCTASTEYRCAYGACIANGTICNGHSDCADGSDETPLLCVTNVEQYTKLLQKECANPLEFACDSGDCIAEELLCDGIPDCSDGSDETLQKCAHILCPAYAFRCGYGGCVAGGAACNGVLECVDGSDEEAAVCAVVAAAINAAAEYDAADENVFFYDINIDGNENADVYYDDRDDGIDESEERGDGIAPNVGRDVTTGIAQRKCFIPLDRLHLSAVTQRENATLRAGSHVEPETIVAYSCDATWLLTDSSDAALCMQNGEWTSPPPRCEKKCDAATLQRGISTIANCSYDEARVSCEENARTTTVARVQCADGYKRISSRGTSILFENNLTLRPADVTTISCAADGEWTAPKFKCHPECAVPSVQTDNGPTESAYGASIYHRSNLLTNADTWLFSCYATILSPKFVIAGPFLPKGYTFERNLTLCIKYTALFRQSQNYSQSLLSMGTGALCFSVNSSPGSVANDPVLHNVRIGYDIDSYEQIMVQRNKTDYNVHNISEIVIPENAENVIDIPALVILVDYIVLSATVRPICLNFRAYNCTMISTMQPKVLPRLDDFVDVIDALSVVTAGEQKCLAFVGETSLLVIDYYKNWLQLYLNRYEYLL